MSIYSFCLYITINTYFISRDYKFNFKKGFFSIMTEAIPSVITGIDRERASIQFFEEIFYHI
ncbi:hypothetical protein BpHYR1_003899 [Brachionus plicatilis]|uniref:Uncharacterized protein n=1 Tax=Brachionus plicatilis TaxID=10195 RepID=A0A3M7PVW9_BRAPC|nr:hypothetical protein BpHYR1_003899 [Brachionus plicatilis]